MKNKLNKLKNIWNKMMYILTPGQKRYGIFVFLMSLIGAGVETLGVSIVIPLVNAMLTPDKILKNKYLGPAFHALHILSKSQIITTMCILVVIIYLIKNLFMVFFSYVRVKYSTKVQRELSTKLMASFMERPYTFFLKVNVSSLLQSVRDDTASIYYVIYQAFNITSSLVTVFCISIFIMVEDILMACAVVILASMCLILMAQVFSKKMKRCGAQSRKYSAETYKYSMQAFQGIKEIKVMRRQNFFSDKFSKTFEMLQKTQIFSVLASESPQRIIEVTCVTGIIFVVALKMMILKDASSFIPQLAAFAIAAFRILPLLGTISGGFNNFVFYCPAVDAVYANLKEKEQYDRNKNQYINDYSSNHIIDNNIYFNNQVMIDHMTWTYPGTDKVILNDLSLSINRGSTIGIMGSSGAGKTTLMDIILGLLKPQSGSITVDGIDIFTIPDIWCKMIGYVPQTVYLTDDTIRNNVAFGIECDKNNDKKVWHALRQAQLDTFIHELPEKLDTTVGDRGVRLSGGQRQRIAIARALYYDPQILIFDEATSALDNETEAAVMESIDILHGAKTLIIVAHRLSTIRNCDEIYEIADGKAIKRNKEELF